MGASLKELAPKRRWSGGKGPLALDTYLSRVLVSRPHFGLAPWRSELLASKAEPKATIEVKLSPTRAFWPVGWSSGEATKPARSTKIADSDDSKLVAHKQNHCRTAWEARPAKIPHSHLILFFYGYRWKYISYFDSTHSRKSVWMTDQIGTMQDWFT
jgi:hypothetical protein